MEVRERVNMIRGKLFTIIVKKEGQHFKKDYNERKQDWKKKKRQK